MKIAFVTEDERTISAHFGRAPKVVVVTVEGGQEVGREVRMKEGHGPGHEHGHGHEHGQGGHHRDHSSKFAPMQDCDVLVARGMGGPAMAHAESMGLQVFLTREQEIDRALEAYLAGRLDHDERRLHQH